MTGLPISFFTPEFAELATNSFTLAIAGEKTLGHSAATQSLSLPRTVRQLSNSWSAM